MKRTIKNWVKVLAMVGVLSQQSQNSILGMVIRQIALVSMLFLDAVAGNEHAHN